MPPLPTIADVFRVTFNFGPAGGLDPHNVVHISSDVDNELSLAAKIDDAVTGAMFQCLQLDYDLVSYTILKLDGSSAGVEVASAAGVSGQASGQSLPGEAAVVSFHTLVRGSRGRGRVFIGPISEDITIGAGLLDGTEVGVMLSAWETFQDDLAAAAGAVVLGVASYVHSDFNEITSMTANTHTATQRRRLLATR